MKKLLLILILFSVTSYADEVKLTCQANYKRTINGILNVNKDGSLEVTIWEGELDKIYRTIVTNGLTVISAGTVPTKDHYEDMDLSNSNRWFLSSKLRNEIFSEQRTTIEINRNTGSINANSNATIFLDGKKNLVEENLSGTCIKVDTTKKKF